MTEPTSGELGGYELIYRSFARRLIHERRYRFYGQPIARLCFLYYDTVTNRSFADNLEQFTWFGWPTPELGSHVITIGFNIQRIGIYMDDMSLCPQCGSFEIGEDYLSPHEMRRSPTRNDWETFEELVLPRRTGAEFHSAICADSNKCLFRQRHFRAREARQKVLEQPPEPEKVQPRHTHVYLLRAGQFCKIGIAGNVSSRIRSIQTSCPYTVVLLKSWQTEHAKASEAAIHRFLHNHRLKGEWFQIPDDTLAWLLALEILPTEAESLTRSDAA